MAKMLFSSQQPEVKVTILPNRKRDVTVLTNEELVVVESLTGENTPSKTMMYQYDGNQFRTVYELTEEEVKANLEKYLEYSPENEPTQEQLQHDDEIIDSFTMELMERGLL